MVERLMGMGRSRHWLPLVVSVFILIAGALLLEPFGRDLMTRAFVFALLALSLDLIWGYTGILSFGQAAFFGIGAYSVGILSVEIANAQIAWGVGLLIGLSLAALGALVVGWLSFYSKGKLPALYVAVLTLAFGELLRQLVISNGNLTGGTGGLSGFPVPALTGESWYFISGAVLLILSALLFRILAGEVGQVLKAVRDNEDRAQYLGYRTPRIKLAAFVVAGTIAALAGYLYSLQTSALSPPLIDFSLATDVVIWTAVGGRGTLIGPVLGAIGIVVTGSTLSSSFPLVWQLIVGAIFVLVVVAMPEGIGPALWRLFFKRTKRVGGAMSMLGASRLDLAEWPQEQPDAAPNSTESRFGDVVLEVRNVEKAYGSFRAVKDVSLTAKEGEIVAIVGPNGAGKSTLIECISDGTARSRGSVTICGHDAARELPFALTAHGLGRKFQTATVFESLSVAESLQLAARKGRRPSIWRQAEAPVLPPAARRVAESTGVLDRLDHPVKDLDHGLKQALELVMVLALEPRVLLLDEPTAGLSTEERAEVAEIVSDLARTDQVCILLVEHDFNFVKDISTRMVVLHEGAVLMDGSVEEVAHSSLVQDVYLGRDARAAT